MRWFFPAWNGDLRLEADGDDASKLIIIQPSPDEMRILAELGTSFTKRRFLKKVWVEQAAWDAAMPNEGNPYREQERREVKIAAPLSKVGPLLVAALKPGRQTLTAVSYKDGRIETVEGSDANALEKVAEKAEKEGKAAATVKRPTPSCPQCMVGAIEPATEVLLAFLTDAQHAEWARRRTITVTGQLTGHRYLIAHRKSPIAARVGRICMDLDDQYVLHFHDQSVPPEEEVLAAKLCLEYREPWLRNEATMLTPIHGWKQFKGFDRVAAAPGVAWNHYGSDVFAAGTEPCFKNPFGDTSDGIPDTHFTTQFGAFLLGFAAMKPHLRAELGI